MFSMKHLLMCVYQVCSNENPWVKIGPAGGGGGEGGKREVIVFHYMCVVKTYETHETSSNGCSKFVQIKALGFKLAPLRGPIYR
jgi:hypothetical protein